MAAKYETVVVLKPELNDAQVKEEEKKIENLLKQEGATALQAESWGRKDLAYSVRKRKAGSFVCFKYESAKSDTVRNVAGVLRIAEPVIKFQTHRLADRVRKFKGNPRRAAGGEQGEEFSDSPEEAF